MRRRPGDGGATLVELLVAMVVLGIIMVPLVSFVLVYLRTSDDTQNRLADSHDVQIATAYFSADVANAGFDPSIDPPDDGFGSAVSTTPSGTYCGSGLGVTKLLLRWDAWPAGGGTAYRSSAAYVVKSDGTLHRVYCATGYAVATDATIVHGLKTMSGLKANAVTAQCPAPDPTCSGSPPPTTITLSIQIAANANDRAAPQSAVTLTGQRRQT